MKIALSVLFSLATVALFAQNTHINYDYNKEQIGFFDLWWQNPAMRFNYPLNKTTDVSFSETITDNSIYNPQNGNKSSNFLFNANAFTKQENKLFYGAASYNNGIRKNVKWNTLTDINRLYPYIIADTIADKLYKEQYYFAGGYAHKFKKITAGIFANYTASTSYGKLDPRPNNTVSDLQVTIGASTPISSNYSLGISLFFDKYQQDQSLSIYKDNGQARIYYLRGFGVADKYFSTMITKNGGGANTIYKEKIYGGSISLYPQTTKGFFAALKAKTSNLELVSGNQNITVAMLDGKTAEIAVGYKINSNYNVKLLSEYQQKEGTEYSYTFGAKLIAEGKKYKTNNLTFGAAFAGKINYNKNTKGNVIMAVKWNSLEQKYMKIGGVATNKKEVDNLVVTFTKNILRQFKKSSLLMKFGATYRHNINKDLKAGNLAVKNAVKELVEPTYKLETENYTAANLLLRYDYFIDNKYSIYLKANATYAYFASSDSNKLYGIGIGLSF